MTATVETPTIVPGVYDIPADIYHADPVPGGSLSSSGARKLLPPSCPARFKWERDNPPPPKKVFELGTAAHKLVLGVGPELVVVDKPRWDDKATKAKVAEIREAGGVPLKPAEWEQVDAMADAIHRHPIASKLLSPERGKAEQTLLWQDRATGVWRRALLDHLPHPTAGRMVIADYKTTASAHPDATRNAIFNYGYHCQAAWYIDGVEALGLAQDPAFVLIFQEKEAPYLVTVVQLDHDSIRLGRNRNRKAIDIYARCVETGHWPGYADDIELISPPAWAYTADEEYV